MPLEMLVIMNMGLTVTGAKTGLRNAEEAYED